MFHINYIIFGLEILTFIYNLSALIYFNFSLTRGHFVDAYLMTPYIVLLNKNICLSIYPSSFNFANYNYVSHTQWNYLLQENVLLSYLLAGVKGIQVVHNFLLEPVDKTT